MPAPKLIDITPIETPGQGNNSAPPQQEALPESAIVVIGVLFILFMFYIIRKLW
jgi:hypothetical protein